MIKGGEVRPEGCIRQLCSDMSPNWKDMRSIADIPKSSEIPQIRGEENG